MPTEENDNQRERNNPKPIERPQTNTEEDRNYSDIRKSHDPDWSNHQPLHEGYRPTEDTTNPQPPSDSGTTDKTN